MQLKGKYRRSVHLCAAGAAEGAAGSAGSAAGTADLSGALLGSSGTALGLLVGSGLASSGSAAVSTQVLCDLVGVLNQLTEGSQTQTAEPAAEAADGSNDDAAQEGAADDHAQTAQAGKNHQNDCNGLCQGLNLGASVIIHRKYLSFLFGYRPVVKIVAQAN